MILAFRLRFGPGTLGLGTWVGDMTLWRDEYVYSGHGKIRRVGASRHFCFTASPVSACIAELRLNDDTFTMSLFCSRLFVSSLVPLTREQTFGVSQLLGWGVHGIQILTCIMCTFSGLTPLLFAFDTFVLGVEPQAAAEETSAPQFLEPEIAVGPHQVLHPRSRQIC
jgi:hypothetical protein